MDFPLEDVASFVPGKPKCSRIVPDESVEYLLLEQGVSLLRSPIIVVKSRHGAHSGAYLVYRAKTGVVIVRSSGSSVYDASDNQREVYLLSEEQLLRDLADWVGMRPQYVFSDAQSMPLADYEQHFSAQNTNSNWHELYLSFGEIEV